MARSRDNLTVRQSVHPATKRVPINVTLSVPGTAETVITIGDQETLEVIRAFALVVDKDCYIELGGTATSASIPLKAGDSFSDDNCSIAPQRGTETSTIISILNSVAGETPTIRGIIAGY